MNDSVEVNPFDAFEDGSVAAIMAFVHLKLGDEGLCDLLETIDADQESLERDAAELEEIGLPDVAAIVAEFAANSLSARKLYCPYEPEDRANYQSRQQSYDRRVKAGPA